MVFINAYLAVTWAGCEPYTKNNKLGKVLYCVVHTQLGQLKVFTEVQVLEPFLKL